MRKMYQAALLLCSAFCVQEVAAQSNYHPGDSSKVIAAARPEYDKVRKIKKVLWGEHYRKEWAVPVEMDVLDMDTFAGGLTPLKLGGGKQTQSLRLGGADGKEYVLRSVNKEVSKAIPQEFVGTFVNDIVQDQISSSNPYAPMTVSALADAAGIYNAKPMLVFVPSSSRLETYNEGFANTICILEERPAGSQEDNAAFGYSKKVVNSQKLFEQVFNSNNHRIDQKEFLKARLFDMWIGDWDRHEDQWLWATFRQGENTIYRPIPRDRDQAFSKLDGVIPQMATTPWGIRRMQNFEYKVNDVNGFNTAGGFLDRSFLTQLTLNDWMQVVEELQTRLTDAMIESAFQVMPAPVFAISGKDVIAKLKQRRNDMKKYAAKYYRFLAKEVDIVGSNEAEWFEVTRISDKATSVAMCRLDENQNVKRIVYQRTFDHSVTNEIRLYGLGGEDQFNFHGKSRKGLLVRVIGGNGTDQVIDHSFVGGWTHKTLVYDNAIELNKSTKEAKLHISNDSLKNVYNRTGYKYNWLAPRFVPGYNPDDGVYLGAGITYRKQGFGKAPFASLQSVWGNYAFQTGAYNFGYDGLLTEAIGKWDLHVNAELNAPNYVLNYFGMGNETKLIGDDKNYNRVRSNQFTLSSTMIRRLGKYHTIESGSFFQSIKVEKTEDRFVSDGHAQLDSGVFKRKYFAGSKFAYRFNTTDNALYPREGIKFSTSFEFIQDIDDTKKAFARMTTEASAYWSVNALTVALRMGGAANLGNNYEFFQAVTLGGTDYLRGYRRSRFAGKSAAWQSAELRLKVKTMNGYYIRGNWGLLAFFDNGRVWLPGEASNKWHHGYGGGVWFLPYNKIAFTATYGMSAEDNLVNIKAGFFF